MTARRALAALLGRLFPDRGRHQRIPDPDATVILPRIPPGGDQADDPTRFDVSRVRPYVERGDEDGPGEFRWLP